MSCHSGSGTSPTDRGISSASEERFVVTAAVFEWRGPAPFHFLAVTGELAVEIRDQAASVTYGWGMIPVACCIGATSFTTSLWPKGDDYYLPLKDAVRDAEGIELGEAVTVEFTLRRR